MRPKKKMSLAKGFIYRHTNEDIRLTGRTLCLAPFRIISVLLSALKWSLTRDSCQDFFPIALKKFDLNMIALSFRLISWSNLCRVWDKWFDKEKDPSTSFYNLMPRKPESSTKFFDEQIAPLKVQSVWFPWNLCVAPIQDEDWGQNESKVLLWKVMAVL